MLLRGRAPAGAESPNLNLLFPFGAVVRANEATKQTKAVKTDAELGRPDAAFRPTVQQSLRLLYAQRMSFQESNSQQPAHGGAPKVSAGSRTICKYPDLP
jgi:hypothetical protein